MSVEDRAQDLLDRFSVEAAVQNRIARLSVQSVNKRSPRKKSVYQRSQSKISVQALYKKRPLSKISVMARGLQTISLMTLISLLAKSP